MQQRKLLEHYDEKTIGMKKKQKTAKEKEWKVVVQRW
jgi:hypothetical protein